MTDEELIELLASKGMGWAVHDVSAHRPGSRELPHVWKWRRAGGVRFMVYDGKGNREWNPLVVEADLDELLFALHVRGVEIPAGPTPKDTCAAIATALATLQPPQENAPDETVQG
jgi:hypothetical protein